MSNSFINNTKHTKTTIIFDKRIKLALRNNKDTRFKKAL